MKEIDLYGAGGHAKVIIDILNSNGLGLGCIFDDNENVTSLNDFPVLRPGASFSHPLIISIGDNHIRQRIVRKLKAAYVSVVHQSAVIDPSVTIGEGSVVMQGAIIQADTQVGKHCIINSGASIDHECRIDDFVHISPHATLCGNVTVGEGSWIGAGAVIIPGVKIGECCKIGAGSVVLKDIPDGSTAFGNPAKIMMK